jgi:hypothetical protein
LTSRTNGPKSPVMTDVSSPRAVVALWPSLEALADDLSSIGVTLPAVRKWPQRGRIPSEYWLAIVQAAAERGIKGVTFETLAEMHAKRSGAPELAEARA